MLGLAKIIEYRSCSLTSHTVASTHIVTLLYTRHPRQARVQYSWLRALLAGGKDQCDNLRLGMVSVPRVFDSIRRSTGGCAARLRSSGNLSCSSSAFCARCVAAARRVAAPAVAAAFAWMALIISAMMAGFGSSSSRASCPTTAMDRQHKMQKRSKSQRKCAGHIDGVRKIFKLAHATVRQAHLDGIRINSFLRRALA